MSTKIEWTEETWNPVTGCTKVSSGCKNCYAERLFPRPYPGRKFTDVRFHPERLEQPLRWRKPRRVFVNSMSDLFHEAVTVAQLDRVFGVMANAPQHTFQVLTKRPERMRAYFSTFDQEDAIARAEDVCHATSLLLGHWGEENTRRMERIPKGLPNVWLGVSVEDQETADTRIPLLRVTPAAVRFLSVEPLLGPVDLAHHLMCQCGGGEFVAPETHTPLCPFRLRIHWVIVGGESGPKARPMHPHWPQEICGQCVAAGVPFLFKQWGEWLSIDAMNPGQLDALDLDHLHDRDRVDVETHPYVTHCRVGKKAAGRELDGRTWDEYPEVPA